MLVIVIGDSGVFYVNDRFVASLDLSGLTEAGDVTVATDIATAHEIEGEVTRFEDFTVWWLD